MHPPPLVVLVRTHSPGNLGAAARACRCFGAELALLEPRAARDHDDARAFASGAEALLEAAGTLETLGEVSERADHVVALTAARVRTARGLPPVRTFSEVAGLSGRLALVFGPERGGLTTAELRRCDALLTVPTRPEFPTLSLPQAVAATLALLATAPEPPAREEARTADLAAVFAVLREALAKAGWPRGGRSLDSVAELESLLKRARPTPRESVLLRGALEAFRRR